MGLRPWGKPGELTILAYRASKDTTTPPINGALQRIEYHLSIAGGPGSEPGDDAGDAGIHPRPAGPKYLAPEQARRAEIPQPSPAGWVDGGHPARGGLKGRVNRWSQHATVDGNLDPDPPQRRPSGRPGFSTRAEPIARPPSPLGWAKIVRPFGPAFRRAASNIGDGPFLSQKDPAAGGPLELLGVLSGYSPFFFLGVSAVPSRLRCLVSIFLMLSTAGNSSGIVPPNSLIV